MIALKVTVPVACFRPGAAREFWETLPLPPPATVYGFLLSLVGETNRNSHIGVRCTAGIIGSPGKSTVLRRMWRIKELGGTSNATQGNGANVRPDYQQLLTNVRLAVLLDSADESSGSEPLELRVRTALDRQQRHRIQRFGGLSLGESTHMIDEVSHWPSDGSVIPGDARIFLLDPSGGMTLPVWVDHVGSAGTRYATGSLVVELGFPDVARIPQIDDGRLSTVSG